MADRPTPLVHLIRHASPDRTRTDLRYDVAPGPPLTPEGEAEAERLGVWLRGTGVVALWASPLERTRRTAELAAVAAGIPVVHGVEGIAEFDIPNIKVEYHDPKLPVPTGYWRSVGLSQNTFFAESFVDELAVRGRKDPVELRRRLYAKAPRLLGVLNLAAEKAVSLADKDDRKDLKEQLDQAKSQAALQQIQEAVPSATPAGG